MSFSNNLFSGKHCVHNLKATQKWRMISSAAFSNVLTTQFQCTWL